jgi:hypothetical protein
VRSHPIQTAADFRFIYRGYDLEVTRAPSGWRVGVYPRTADLPILRRSEVYAFDPDGAIVEAKARVPALRRLPRDNLAPGVNVRLW